MHSLRDWAAIFRASGFLAVEQATFNLFGIVYSLYNPKG